MIHNGWWAFGGGSLLSGFLFGLAQDASELLCQWTVNSFNYWPNPKNVNKGSSILNTEHNTLKNQLYFYFWVDHCFTFLWHQLSIHSPVSTGVYSWGHVIQWFSNWFSRMFPSGCFGWMVELVGLAGPDIIRVPLGLQVHLALKKVFCSWNWGGGLGTETIACFLQIRN